jgi:hypothetical protein
LIDNLDKSWDKKNDINILSKYILGLLSVGGSIVEELAVFKKRHTGINFRMLIFLRADIFRHIERNAREPDKLQVITLKWDDQESLFSVIEERFTALYEGEVNYGEFWENYIVKKVEGELLKDYIFKRIFPRPRDIIYFFKIALDIAINRRHQIIEEVDVIYAYKEYSTWVFKTVLVENGITVSEMETFLYSFIGLHKELRRIDILDLLEQIEIKSESMLNDVDYFIDHLFKLSIIGKEVSKGDFRFYYGYEDLTKIDVQFRNYGSNKYLIHPAFYPFFEIN